MLLQEEKNEYHHICYFDSSNILCCKYKRDTKQLAVIFKSGTQYVYENVTIYTFQRFKVSKSQGKGLNKHIKGKFDYSKVEGKIDTKPLLEIIDKLKKSK